MKSMFLWACLLGSLSLVHPINSQAQGYLDPCPVKRAYVNSNYFGISLSDSLHPAVNGDYNFYFFSEAGACEIYGAAVNVFLTNDFAAYFPAAATEELLDPTVTNLGLIIDLDLSTCPSLTTAYIRQQATVINGYRSTPETSIIFTFVDGEYNECYCDAGNNALARNSKTTKNEGPANTVWTTTYASSFNQYATEKQRYKIRKGRHLL